MGLDGQIRTNQPPSRGAIQGYIWKTRNKRWIKLQGERKAEKSRRRVRSQQRYRRHRRPMRRRLQRRKRYLP